MTCRRAPKAHVLSVVSLLITIFAVLTALLAPAELRGGVQPSAKATDVAMPQDASAPLFLPAAIYDSGGQLGWYIAVADLNGDGKPDMVVVNYGGNANGDGWLGVLLGKGNGSFQPVVSYDPGGGGPTAVAIGDLNNDGKLDLVVGNQGCRVINSQCLGVLLGNGDGTFQPVVIYENDGQSYGGGPGISVPIFIADLNGDTKPDLLIANQTGLGQVGDGVVGVLLGKGDGTFEPVVGYDSGGFGTSAAAMADVNGDGKLDVVVVNCGSQSFYCPATAGTVGILLGNGDGTFQSVKTYSRGGRALWPLLLW